MTSPRRQFRRRHPAAVASVLVLIFSVASSSSSTAHSFVIPRAVSPGRTTRPTPASTSSSSPTTTAGVDEEDTSTAEVSAAPSDNNNSIAAAMSSASTATTATADDEDVAISGLPPRALRRLVEYATSYAAANGLQVEVRGAPGRYVSAPISLLPQSYPSYAFERAMSLSGPFGVLVDRVSRDGGFLRRTLAEARGVDEYTDTLLAMYEEIYLGENRGMEWGRHARSADRLGILRSDYMLHREKKDDDDAAPVEGGGGGEDDGRRYSLKQVELNTIASSFAGLASTVASMHSFLTRRLEDGGEGGELSRFLDENERAVSGDDATTATTVEGGEGLPLPRGVPESPAMTRLPKAIAVAYDRYRSRFLPPPPPADRRHGVTTTSDPVVLFVVQPGETNTVDQRMLEFALWKNHGIPVVRMSLAEAHGVVELDESTGRLALVERRDDGGDDGSGGATATTTATARGREVAVVYYRAGYAPTDYPSGKGGAEWLARERLERGRATKCPNLGYHLAGTKKVQQELAREGAVERFFPDDGAAATARLVRSAFAGLYGLGADANAADMRAVGDVLYRGGEGRYVLKPQREGGGYNFYGEDMARKLRENCSVGDGGGAGDVALGPALSEFILMERLFPPQQRAVLLRNGRVEGEGMTISELGCFGTIVASGDGEVVHNEYAGFLLRTKFSGVDEGGVASGFATLSSPYLC